MNLNNYTIKAQEAIQKAVEIAGSLQQQAVESGHIAKALLLDRRKRDVLPDKETEHQPSEPGHST